MKMDPQERAPGADEAIYTRAAVGGSGLQESLKDKKIIIADDSETFMMYLGILMRRMGLRAVPARNGLEVLKLVTVFRPDLVLMDVSMPIMDGVTALRHIKGDEVLSIIPVVMVTVNDKHETVEECERLGCSGYLTKPVNLSVLHEVVYDNVVFQNGKKRRSLRAAYNRKVVAVIEGKREVYFGVSLSEGGIYLRSRNPLPLGGELSISIPLDGETCIHLKGNVIYQKDVFSDISTLDPGMAVAFSDVTPDQAKALRYFIQLQLAWDLVEEQDEPIITTE